MEARTMMNVKVTKLMLKPQFRTHKQAMTCLENAQKGNKKRAEQRIVRQGTLRLQEKFNEGRIS